MKTVTERDAQDWIEAGQIPRSGPVPSDSESTPILGVGGEVYIHPAKGNGSVGVHQAGTGEALEVLLDRFHEEA